MEIDFHIRMQAKRRAVEALVAKKPALTEADPERSSDGPAKEAANATVLNWGEWLVGL